MNENLRGKKLLILGGNPETVPLVKLANDMGIKTYVSSARETDPAKKIAWKAHNYGGMETSEWVEYVKAEGIDGVLVGVADILVPAYSRVCEALNYPCYATEQIVKAFSSKDNFKRVCGEFGIKGSPEYNICEDGTVQDNQIIHFPVMVKPVDNGGGVGMSLAHNKRELLVAIRKALDYSKQKRYIVEKYMNCDDVCMYYTFKDGKCSLSCIFDRFTTNLQDGMTIWELEMVYSQ